VKYNVKNIYYHELIGLNIEILEYPDMKLVGLKGRIVDETYKTLLIERVNNGFTRVFKEHGVFKIKLPNGKWIVVKGWDIMGRPEDRLKMIMR